MKLSLIALAAFALALLSAPVRSAALDLSAAHPGAIGEAVAFLVEGPSRLELDDAIQAHGAGRFAPSTDAALNFGIGSRPVWLRVDVLNPGSRPLARRLSLETSWIDRLEVYFVRDGQTMGHYRTGDALPFAQRPIENRFFLFDHEFGPGETTVYLRAETRDPMVLPLYLTTVERSETRQALAGYSYGALYGGIATLLAYNLMLFFSLKSRRYLHYSLYLAAFVIMNASYTGHGFKWLWPDAPHWQQWLNPVLIMVFLVAGLLFATRFLNTKSAFPRLHRLVMGGCIGFGVLEALSVVAGARVLALLLSFTGVLLFCVAMVTMGAVALYAGNKSAKYFLIASVTHVSTAAVTAVTVWGLVPYSALGYRAVDIGMLIDAVLLAMALADQFRISQEEKLRAEKLANVDPLTGMNNRRGFYEVVRPIWSTGLRKKHDASVVTLDIDRFKSINDTYGHAHGDNVLRHVARVLSESARTGDILARWGGEEFILFLPETTLDEATAIAERLRSRISEIHLELGGDAVDLTASFGVAHSQAVTAAIDELILAADEQLYAAKELGRDRVCAGDLAMTGAATRQDRKRAG